MVVHLCRTCGATSFKTYGEGVATKIAGHLFLNQIRSSHLDVGLHRLALPPQACDIAHTAVTPTPQVCVRVCVSRLSEKRGRISAVLGIIPNSNEKSRWTDFACYSLLCVSFVLLYLPLSPRVYQSTPTQLWNPPQACVRSVNLYLQFVLQCSLQPSAIQDPRGKAISCV